MTDLEYYLRRFNLPQGMRIYTKHLKSEKIYVVFAVANLTADKPEYVPTVVYISVETSEVFSRPLSEFIQKFELY